MVYVWVPDLNKEIVENECCGPIDVIEKSCLLILESRQCRYSHASHACLYCAAHFRMLP